MSFGAEEHEPPVATADKHSRISSVVTLMGLSEEHT